MTTRETSGEAFSALIASGQLKGKQRLVAEAFFAHGPGTSAEVLRAAQLDRNVNLMRARVTELVDAGTLRENGVRKCKITGRNALVFVFAPGGPKRTKTTTPSAEVVARRIADWLEQNSSDIKGGRILAEAAQQIRDGAWRKTC